MGLSLTDADITVTSLQPGIVLHFLVVELHHKHTYHGKTDCAAGRSNGGLPLRGRGAGSCKLKAVLKDIHLFSDNWLQRLQWNIHPWFFNVMFTWL